MFLYIASALIPLSKSKFWWVRAFDFPRMQLAAFGLTMTIVYGIYFPLAGATSWLFFIAMLAVLGLDAYRIIPYTPLYPVESIRRKSDKNGLTIGVLVANVLQDNQNYSMLVHRIKQVEPDLVLLLEVNQLWIHAIDSDLKNFPYRILHPLENTYGIALYSKLPLTGTVEFLVDPKVPSIHGTVQLGDSIELNLIALHPKPPVPDEGPSTERDAELILVARQTQKIDKPILVVGDLNDVAWSHTSRLFRRISGLLDPRVGRRPFGTFPALSSPFTFPLDYVFHSDDLVLRDIERLGGFGSDHYPLYAKFLHAPRSKGAQKGLEPAKEDFDEANETVNSVC